MSSDPFTPAELDAGARAVGQYRRFRDTDGYPSIRIGSYEDEARAVLAAVLPAHAARIQRETAEQIAAALEHFQAEAANLDIRYGTAMEHAATVARLYATTPTEGDRDG